MRQACYTSNSMSTKRRDLHRARVRRDRIRREKHAQRTGPPPAPDSGPDPVGLHPFAAERSLREVEALLDCHQFQSVDEINVRLQELTSGGRISEMAGAWKRDDPKWRAQELAYEALEADDAIEALRLAREATDLDPDCIDAQRLMVSLVPMRLANRIELMREMVDKAERNLGERFFEEHAAISGRYPHGLICVRWNIWPRF